MTPSDLDVIKARIRRIQGEVMRPSGSGFEQTFVAYDGSNQSVFFSAVKSPEQLEDELLTLFIWIWSLKDRFKLAYKMQGLDPQAVESFVNKAQPLKYVADIANRAKHGQLRESRSGEFAELVDVGIEIPQAAIAKISVEANSVSVSVNKPSEAKLCAKVRLKCGTAFEAFAVMNEAIAAWELLDLPQS